MNWNSQNFVSQHLYKRSLLSFLLWPFSLVFSIIVVLRRVFYRKFRKAYRSRCRIICVGNIVSGGSGKTPFTIFLAECLRDKGKKIAVSHRGYKGEFEKTVKLISDREQIFDHDGSAGDEPYLLASKLKGIPVVVGRDRTSAIKLLEKEYPDLDVIILDDSFQHLKVYHDLDFVVFNSTGGTGNGFVLPAGILREPLSACRYADCLVVKGMKEDLPELKKYEITMIYGRHEIDRIYNREGENYSINSISGSKNLLVSGIGQPESFEKLLAGKGISFIRHYKFSDHYDYREPKIWKKIRQYIDKVNIDHVLTTEKDYAKLKTKDLGNISLIVVSIAFKPEGDELNKLLLPQS
jgi:tetraacyldisaccharide 4'-kinase